MSTDPVQNTNTAQDKHTAQEVCLNCGAELYGPYCYSCGQKVIEARDRTAGAYIRGFFEESFSFDSKFFKTFKYLFTKPGFLTLEYIHGRINSYVTPLKLYLFLSVAAFFIGSLISPDNLNDLRGDFDVGSFSAGAFVDNYVKRTGVPYEVFEEKYNSELGAKLPLYFVGLVVVFSLPFKLIYMSHKRYYAEHLVFSIHFFSFLLAVLVLSSLLELVIPDISVLFVFVLPFFYLLLSLKRVYGQKFILTFFETIIFYIYYVVLLMLTVISAFFVTLFLV